MNTTPRVLIDGRMFVGRFSGVARVVTCLLRELVRGGEVTPVVLLGASGDDTPLVQLGIESVRSDFDRTDREPIRRRQWEQHRLHHWIRMARADVYHATWNSGVPETCGVPTILTIHDLIPWNEPVRSLSGFLRRRAYRQSVRESAQRADRVVTVSEFTRGEVLRILGLAPECVQIVPNGVDWPLAPDPRCAGSVETRSLDPGGPHLSARASERTIASEPNPLPYVLYVGGHEPRKNLHLVLAGLASYWHRHDQTLRLHLTGSRPTLHADAARAFESLPDPTLIRFLGDPTDEALDLEYAQAASLLLLSRAEGFGLPVLEAMARGCPVVAAPLGAIPEVAGSAACYVDPDNADAVADAVRRLQQDPKFREERIHAGFEQAQRYSWAESARRMAWLYHAVADHRRTQIATASSNTLLPRSSSPTCRAAPGDAAHKPLPPRPAPAG